MPWKCKIAFSKMAHGCNLYLLSVYERVFFKSISSLQISPKIGTFKPFHISSLGFQKGDIWLFTNMEDISKLLNILLKSKAQKRFSWARAQQALQYIAGQYCFNEKWTFIVSFQEEANRSRQLSITYIILVDPSMNNGNTSLNYPVDWVE